jgi:hypothetical protein
MARTGLTNFVVWALATFVPGYLLLPVDTLFFMGAVALIVAWLTRYWPEGLGVTAAVVALLLLHGPLGGFELIAPVALAVTMAVVWRFRSVAVTEPRAALPNGTATPTRLVVATVLASVAVFVIDGFLLLAFGFTCQSDTSHATPGSDRAAWCDALGAHGLGLAVLFGPALLVLLVGIYAASRGRAREVMITVIVGFALTIALHVPDFVLSNAAP